jgi:hypothetical protein
VVERSEGRIEQVGNRLNVVVGGLRFCFARKQNEKEGRQAEQKLHEK